MFFCPQPLCNLQHTSANIDRPRFLLPYQYLSYTHPNIYQTSLSKNLHDNVRISCPSEKLNKVIKRPLSQHHSRPTVKWIRIQNTVSHCGIFNVRRGPNQKSCWSNGFICVLVKIRKYAVATVKQADFDDKVVKNQFILSEGPLVDHYAHYLV